MSVYLPTQRIRFIDTLNYLPMSLEKMPKVMGLPDTLKKGFFPHGFNTIENFDKQFPSHPDIAYYDPDSMNPRSQRSLCTVAQWSLQWAIWSQQRIGSILPKRCRGLNESCTGIQRQIHDDDRTIWQWASRPIWGMHNNSRSSQQHISQTLPEAKHNRAHIQSWGPSQQPLHK